MAIAQPVSLVSHSFSHFSFVFFFFPSPGALPLGSPVLPLPLKHRFFLQKSVFFKARFWVREEERKKNERRKKNALAESGPTETGPLPQSHAHEPFAIRVRGNPSLRRPWTCCEKAVQMNIDVGRNSSEPWTSFTQFTFLNEEPPDRYTWSGEAADKHASNNKA